jgi:hypothetical protein
MCSLFWKALNLEVATATFPKVEVLSSLSADTLKYVHSCSYWAERNCREKTMVLFKVILPPAAIIVSGAYWKSTGIC